MGQLDYAVIGNCQISALLDAQARIVWCCMPRFDSPSVFAALLGGKGSVESRPGGSWCILPVHSDYKSEQAYLPNTNVLRTVFTLGNGDSYEILDFAPRFSDESTYFRPPLLVRIIRTLKGNPRVRMCLKPVMSYGAAEPSVSLSGYGIVYHADDTTLFCKTDIPQSYVIDCQPFELSGTYYCMLSHGAPITRPLHFAAEEYLERTISYWRTWVTHCRIPFEYQDEVIRSALALKLHVFEDTGAIIAATSTSLPEAAADGRTWDYRYCWLRDAYFVINALNQLGQFEEMQAFIGFLHNILSGTPEGLLQPVYSITGRRELSERELPWLPGWEGIGPVRVGNAAWKQPQYDAYGEMVLAVTRLFFDCRLETISKEHTFAKVVQLVGNAIATFDQADAGLWEFRGERRQYLFSKLMSWAAVDRGLKIARRLGRHADFSHWSSIKDAMHRRIEAEGWNEQLGYFTQTLKGQDPDASCLLLAPLNFMPADDPRYVRTVQSYEALLMRRGFVYRYRAPDDFGVPKHAFTVCTFWMVDALASLGRVEDARKVFAHVLSRLNHVGLLSEDIDPATGALWGNFPQTYSHVGLINSAFRLSKPWTEAF